MITIKELEFHYPTGEFNLNIQNFSVTQGSKVAVIGPSGSGKTTLLHLIAGIFTPHKGLLEVDTTVINELSDKERRDFRISNIGFVFQDFELLDYLNVIDNILSTPTALQVPSPLTEEFVPVRCTSLSRWVSVIN